VTTYKYILQAVVKTCDRLRVAGGLLGVADEEAAGWWWHSWRGQPRPDGASLGL